MRLHLIAAATLTLCTTAAFAQDAERQPPAESQPAQEEVSAAQEEEDERGNEVVCRTERATGSLTRRTRTCLTRNEWNDIQARTRDEVNDMTRTASGGVQCRGDQFGGC